MLGDCVGGERSALAHAAALVLGQLRAPVPEVPLADRLLRAARELAAPIARPSSPACSKRSASATPRARSCRRYAARRAPRGCNDPTLAHVRDTLTELGVPAAELPRARTPLDPWQGIVPHEREVRGAYATASSRCGDA